MTNKELNQGKITMVDDEDFVKFGQYHWTFVSNPYSGYVIVLMNGKRIQLHRLITDCPNDKFIDHINGNGLDNRKENLRIVTKQQNNFNRRKTKAASSQYVGVYWDKAYQQWRVRIASDWKHHLIGMFDNERHAAMAYDMTAYHARGEYAKLNFPNAIHSPISNPRKGKKK